MVMNVWLSIQAVIIKKNDELVEEGCGDGFCGDDEDYYSCKEDCEIDFECGEEC